MLKNNSGMQMNSNELSCFEDDSMHFKQPEEVKIRIKGHYRQASATSVLSVEETK